MIAFEDCTHHKREVYILNRASRQIPLEVLTSDVEFSKTRIDKKVFYEQIDTAVWTSFLQHTLRI